MSWSKTCDFCQRPLFRAGNEHYNFQVSLMGETIEFDQHCCDRCLPRALRKIADRTEGGAQLCSLTICRPPPKGYDTPDDGENAK